MADAHHVALARRIAPQLGHDLSGLTVEEVADYGRRASEALRRMEGAIPPPRRAGAPAGDAPGIITTTTRRPVTATRPVVPVAPAVSRLLPLEPPPPAARTMPAPLPESPPPAEPAEPLPRFWAQRIGWGVTWRLLLLALVGLLLVGGIPEIPATTHWYGTALVALGLLVSGAWMHPWRGAGAGRAVWRVVAAGVVIRLLADAPLLLVLALVGAVLLCLLEPVALVVAEHRAQDGGGTLDGRQDVGPTALRAAR